MSKADVKESIAGYYYQFLLATEELVNLYMNDKNGSVAVEKGADIRVQDNDDLFIESKFYGKEKFTRKDEAITRTIFNFAIQYKSKLNDSVDLNDVKFQFKTNIKIDELTFFESWKKGSFNEEDTIRYIQYCLIKESKLLKTTDYDKIINQINTENIHDLIKEEAYLNEDQILDYIGKFNFISAQKTESKLKAENKVRRSIETKIIKKAETDKITARKVMNLIIENFFKTTLSNKNDNVLTSFIDEVIENDENYKVEFLEDSTIREYKKIIEETMSDYSEYLEELEVPTSDYNEIVIDLRNNLKILIERIREKGSKEVLRNFLLTDAAYDINSVIEILQPFSEFIVKTNKRYGSTRLVGLKGINNLGFTGHDSEYLIQTGVNQNVNKLRNKIFSKFFTKIIDDKVIQELDKAEAIYFQSNLLTEYPCKIDKNKFQDMIPDITDPNPGNLQAYFIAQDYRCSHCLEYQHDSCPYSINLSRESKI